MPSNGKHWKWSDEARKRVAKYKHDPRKKYFVWMHDRCAKTNRKCGFARTAIGFQLFCNDIGTIPVGMLRPSVGRIDHDHGYIAGNIQWEEFKDNNWKNRKVEDQRAKTKMAKEIEDEIPF